jgi:D-methionine transport system substrate-binding protein
MNKFLKLSAAAALALSLGACSSSSDSTGDETSSSDDLVTITVGATSSPHAIILNEAVEAMKEAGYDLQVKEFSDYTLIDDATSNGSLDANYFQHQPYLDSYNADNGYEEGVEGYLVSVGAIHYEPLGAYSKTLDKIDAESVPEGATVVIPNDVTNGGRALLLLEDLGLIEVDDAAGTEPSVNEITSNPLNLNIVEVNAELTATKLDEADIAVVNGNYALDAEITDYLIDSEAADSAAAQLYQNVIAVREEDKDNPAVLKLVEILKSDEIKSFIEETFGVSVVPAA